MTIAHVYLLESGERFKIGYTKNIKKRLRQLRTGSPFDIRLVHSLEAEQPQALEKQFHDRFAKKRIRGEWFRLDAADVREFLQFGKVPKAANGADAEKWQAEAQRLAEQLEQEREDRRRGEEFYRTHIEDITRENALTVAALREAIKAMPKALPAPLDAQEVRSVSATARDESASSGAQKTQPEAQEQPESSQAVQTLSGAQIEAQRPPEARRRVSLWKWLIGG